MRSHPFPYLHIKVSKIALGDADIVPINPVGMREVHAGNADIAVFDGSASPYAVRPALRSYGLFTNNVLGRLILSDTLKRCLSNAVAVCPAAEIDFDYHLRLHPYRFPGALLFRRDRFKRSLRYLEGFELSIKRTGHFMGETCTGAPRIFEGVAIIDTQHQCADGARIGRRRHQTRNDEFLPIRAFGLDPFMRAPGVVWGIGQF